MMACLVAASVVDAHGKLSGSSPAEGSRLAVAPAAITLRFNEAMQLTAVAIEGARGTKQAIVDLPRTPAAAVQLRSPSLAAGDYTLRWRGIGPDGHVVSGALHFSIQGANPASHAARP
jgi:methionine-rich copper-binding protein CopC